VTATLGAFGLITSPWKEKLIFAPLPPAEHTGFIIMSPWQLTPETVALPFADAVWAALSVAAARPATNDTTSVNVRRNLLRMTTSSDVLKTL